MKRLADELRAQLPPLYAQEHNKDPLVYLKFFTPDNYWTWFVTEGSPDDKEEEGDKADFRFFGFVYGHFGEWGYFLLSEMESARGPKGLPIERDLGFKPAPWSEVKKQYE